MYYQKWTLLLYSIGLFVNDIIINNNNNIIIIAHIYALTHPPTPIDALAPTPSAHGYLREKRKPGATAATALLTFGAIGYGFMFIYVLFIVFYYYYLCYLYVTEL